MDHASKTKHGVNMAMYAINAVLWATVAKQPGIALCWLAISVGCFFAWRKA